MPGIHSHALNGELKKLIACINEELDSGRYKTIKEVIESRDEDGYTALLLAVMSGRVHVAKYLIDNGADLRVYSVSYASTPLHMATSNMTYLVEHKKNVENFCEIIRMLLQKDVGLLDLVDSSCFTPFDLMLYRNCLDATKQFLQILKEVVPNYPRLHELEEMIAKELAQEEQLSPVTSTPETVLTEKPRSSSDPSSSSSSSLSTVRHRKAEHSSVPASLSSSKQVPQPISSQPGILARLSQFFGKKSQSKQEESEERTPMLSSDRKNQ